MPRGILITTWTFLGPISKAKTSRSHPWAIAARSLHDGFDQSLISHFWLADQERDDALDAPFFADFVSRRRDPQVQPFVHSFCTALRIDLIEALFGERTLILF